MTDVMCEWFLRYYARELLGYTTIVAQIGNFVKHFAVGEEGIREDFSARGSDQCLIWRILRHRNGPRLQCDVGRELGVFWQQEV